MFTPTDKLVIIAAADYTRQRPDGYAQVVAGVAPTLRPANRSTRRSRPTSGIPRRASTRSTG